MNPSYSKPTIINKEEIILSTFPTQDVLQSIDERRQRMVDLERSRTLGNLEHCKIKIIFEDTAGVKQVETTIWGVTEDRIILKSGGGIPINRIHEVRI